MKLELASQICQKIEDVLALKYVEKHTVIIYKNYIKLLFIEMQHDGELKYFKDMALHIKHEMEKK